MMLEDAQHSKSDDISNNRDGIGSIKMITAPPKHV